MEKLKENLARNLQKRVKFEPSKLREVLAKFQVINKTKQAYLLMEGELCDHIYYVSEGVCKSFIMQEEAKPRIIMFAFTDWWITDIDSFTNGRHSKINIQTISDSLILKLAKTDFDYLTANCPAFESAFRYMMQYSYIREQNRALELITDDSFTRYRSLLARYPTVQELVSQKDIASYLGITPEFLSSLKLKWKKDLGA